MLTRRIVLALPIAALPAVALAHHGWSSFDMAKTLDLTGAVIRSTYENPHGTLVMLSEGREITIDLAPRSRMERRGLAEADIAPGKVVRILAYQHRSEPTLYRAEWIEPGGKGRIELR